MATASPLPVPLLLPTPRRVEPLGGASHLPPSTPPAIIDPHLPAQGYRLEHTAGGLRLIAADAAGERHALATLAQLRRQGPLMPHLRIDDAPAFAVRGAMLDISRDRIPTMAEFARLIPQLASWKYNHLQLYVEHTVAYAGCEDAWRGLDPLTPDELRQLDALCAAHGIELAANQNCFGHLSGFLRHSRWSDLGEIAPDGSWSFNGLVTRQGGFSLCPGDPRSLDFVRDLLSQLTPLIASPWLNIGCDETFDVGQGRSQAVVAQRGRAAVYLDFVKSVCDIARSLGKRPQFWADIALEHPEHLADLPADLCGLAWCYEPDGRFAEWCTALRAGGREAWVCPGTSSWRSITGRSTERRANLLAAADQGLAAGASGYLVTDWGDLGHRQQWPISAIGLAEGAHRGWSGTAAIDDAALGMHALGNAALGPWMHTLGDADHHLRVIGGALRQGQRQPLKNSTVLFTDWHLPVHQNAVGSPATWRDVDERLATLAGHLPAADAQIRDELGHTLRWARLSAQRAAGRRAGDATVLRALIQPTAELIAEHRALWTQRSRVGGLAASCAHHERVLTELRTC